MKPTKLKLSHGYHWRTTQQRLYFNRLEIATTLRAAAFLAFVGVLWLFAMERDYREVAEMDAQKSQMVLIDCMNGKAVFVAEDRTEAIVCEKAWNTKL